LALAQDETCDDDSLLLAIEEATLYSKKVGKATFWVETGTSLASYKDDQIIAAIFEANQDADWASHLDNFVMVNQPRGGDLVITVADETTKEAMIGKSMRILDASYPVITPMTGAGGSRKGLDSLFYVDITNIRYNFDSAGLMKALRRLKTLPLFQGFRSTIAGTSCHTNAWRVYFCTEEIPANLVINNHPVDQLRFHGVTYGVYAKYYTPSPVTKKGGRSMHCLDLDRMTADTGHDASGPQNSSKRTRFSEVPPPMGSTTSHPEEPAPPQGNSASGDSDPRPTRMADPNPTQPVQTRVTADEESLPMDVEEFTTPKRVTKRKDREATLTLADWVTPNFFDDLYSVKNIAIWHVDRWNYSKPLHTYRVAVRDVDCSTMPSDALVKRMHIKDKRLEWHPDHMTLTQVIAAISDASQPMSVSSEQENVLLAEATQGVSPDSFSAVERAKPEELWQSLHRSPLQGNIALSTLQLENPAIFDQTVRLHSWHRWISASFLPHSTTFLQGFRRIFQDKPTWEYMYAITGSAGFTAPELPVPETSFLDLEDAISAFELWLAVQVNWLHKSDAWLLYVTKRPVVWVPAQKSVRMLSPMTLFGILHSDFGRSIVSQLRMSFPGKWSNLLWEVISTGYSYPEGSMMCFTPGESPTLALGNPLLY
jgi:hypothetical protein